MAFTTKPRKLITKSGSGRRSSSYSGLAVPDHFRCPISLEMMKDPVTLPTGITYDRQSIERWLDAGNRACPVTGEPVNSDDDVIPNHSLRRMIQDWCVANRSHGVERIPTPRSPVTTAQIKHLLAEIASASLAGNCEKCAELVGKIEGIQKESELAKRRVVEAGAAPALAACFECFANVQTVHSDILTNTLSALANLFPLGEEARRHIGSPESVKALVSILNSGSLSGRLNAVLVIKELVSSSSPRAASVAEVEGLIDALAKLVKKPDSMPTTKASLTAIYYMVFSNAKVATIFAGANLVEVLIEMLADAERGVCERALGVLDEMLSCAVARARAQAHALAVPVLVKKMFRVSETATEMAVSALWKLCKKPEEEDEEESAVRARCLIEGLEVGAFQKLLVLLQVGCREGIKEKSSELLKMLNGFRGRLECIDSMDFKGLKRSF